MNSLLANEMHRNTIQDLEKSPQVHYTFTSKGICFPAAK